ncbi:hypothetical protein F5887DRAFT_932281 [Amanita rubescens]|nr:hypothetical protein F5887DRAFT_1030461 [Amanita rubescens]KAF8351759.1 hypothetical protein F5887DRAFT_932281 [Amanita rubescens]
MDFLDVGHVNQSHSEEGNSEVPSAIRGVLIQKREALNSLKHEIARIEEDIVRLGTALAPHNHNLLPNEILGRIFILVARDHGTVHFPIPKGQTPPQLTISHVCPHWRRVALRTSELWSNTELLVYTLDTRNHDHNVRLHQRWILRAGTFPVTVSIRFPQESFGDVAIILQRVLLPIQIRRLHLHLTYEQLFVVLSELPETALSSSSELELDLTLPEDGEAIDMNNLPLITRIRSVKFGRGDIGSWFDQFSLSLPLSRLRSLDFSIFLVDLQPIFYILRRTPELQALHFQVSRHQADQFDRLQEQEIALPSVRALHIFFQGKNGIELDMVLRRFTCPSLTSFTLYTYCDYSTGETLGILKQQYNMQGIQDVLLGGGGFALPISSILQNAPALHSLVLSSTDAIMDDKAIIGISNGTLGRSLRTLQMYFPCDIGCKWL